VIYPAAEQDLTPPLQAERVDVTVLSGNVVSRILEGVAHCRIVLADISVTTGGRWAGQPNGNVMYELGLSHAVRHEPEVVVIRSDDEELNFDVAGIQVHRYRRDDLPASRALVARLLADARAEIDLTKSLLVERAVDTLDSDALKYFSDYAGQPFYPRRIVTTGDDVLTIAARAALARLQALGILRAARSTNAERPIIFVWTDFGRAVARRMGIPINAA
jgi:hypothetical protein